MHNDVTLSSEQEPGASKIILIVEDDDATGEFLVAALSLESQYQPLVVHSSSRALEVVKSIKPHLCILDYLLSDGNGLDLYDQLRAIDGLEAVPVMFLSASSEMHRQVVEQRNLLVLDKPFDLDTLLQTIEEQLHPSVQANP